MNPLLNRLNNSGKSQFPQQQQPPARNPLDMIGQLNQTMDYVNQNGGNAEGLARKMAEEKGIDINTVLDQARSMQDRFNKFGINLRSLFKRS